MSLLSRHDHHHHHHGRRSHAPPPADSSSGAPALDLLDEYWFFSNTLVKHSSGDAHHKPPPLPRSPSTSTTKPQHGSPARRLLRTPSLPSPRPRVVEQEEEAGSQQIVEVDDDDLNWSSIYEGVLRNRIAESPALRRAPSMPVASSAMGHRDEASATKSAPSMPRLRHSHSTNKTSGEVRPLSGNQRSKSAFQDKKCRSSSDLESIEVQGFKDLGFVFDKDDLRENLADVLPGLRGSKARTNSHCRRPYLSEAWQRPPLIRVQSDAAEMKDQLRVWAQAVACNVRQDS